jgi:DNA-binding transcriptional LysR family regulator
MRIIPDGYSKAPDLHHLQVFDVLLREHSLTRAARELDVTQPALSKTLAQLRQYFDDPLFVRVASRMEPTAKALQLQMPVRAILNRTASLRSEHMSFNPRLSHRTFNFCVVDAGLLKLLPPLVNRLLTEAPNVRLHVHQLEAIHLERWLESGKLDFAMGSFPSIPKSIRCQQLWVEQYVSLARRRHPRMSSEPTLRAFVAEKHVLVSLPSSGHAHQMVQRLLEAAVPRKNIICRIPIFTAAAVLVKHTDAITTLPLSVATVLAKDLELHIITPPIKLPKIDIFQYWHDRFHRDPANEWIRSVFKAFFCKDYHMKRSY